MKMSPLGGGRNVTRRGNKRDASAIDARFEIRLPLPKGEGRGEGEGDHHQPATWTIPATNKLWEPFCPSGEIFQNC
jgi:hypothetical protein